MNAPLEKVRKRLKERSFCTGEGEPTAKGLWTSLDADQIIQLSHSVNRGLQNSDRFVDTWTQCSRIQSILTFSLAKTLAQKDNISVPQVFRRFGKDLSILLKGQGGKADRQVSCSQNQDWAKKKRAFQGGDQNDMDVMRTLVRFRTRSTLGTPCGICGEAHTQIEMHPIRPIRKRSNKRVATGFNRLLRAMNRKHVPVCSDGHRKIHRGEYDGLKLSNLAYLPR